MSAPSALLPRTTLAMPTSLAPACTGGNVQFWARLGTGPGNCFVGAASDFLKFLGGFGVTERLQASGYYDSCDPIPCECSEPDCTTDPNFVSCGPNGCVPCCPQEVVPIACPPGQIPFCSTFNEQTTCVCYNPTLPPPPPPPPPQTCPVCQEPDAKGKCQPVQCAICEHCDVTLNGCVPTPGCIPPPIGCDPCEYDTDSDGNCQGQDTIDPITGCCIPTIFDCDGVTAVSETQPPCGQNQKIDQRTQCCRPCCCAVNTVRV